MVTCETHEHKNDKGNIPPYRRHGLYEGRRESCWSVEELALGRSHQCRNAAAGPITRCHSYSGYKTSLSHHLLPGHGNHPG